MAADSSLGTVVTNPVVRKAIYGIYIVTGVILGAVQVAFAAIEGAGQPDWLTVVLAVYAFLSVPVGSLALVNTTAGETQTSDPAIFTGTPNADFR